MKFLPIRNLSKDFIFGADISSIISLEQAGIRFYDFSNRESDLFKILSDAGITCVRIRVWNNPYDSNGNGYGGGNCDLEKAIEIGRRASIYNIKILLNFHYSDFWSDPVRQLCPKEWNTFNIEEKESALYKFTYNSLVSMHDAGVLLHMVQIGNEINNGMAGEHDIINKCRLLKSGIQAVKDFNSAYSASIKSVLHYTDPNLGFADICKYLNDNGVDYDIFGASFYQMWHGNPSILTNSLKYVCDTYNKEVIIAETAYPFDAPKEDFYDYDISVDGQMAFLRDVVSYVSTIGLKCIGMFYWEPAWCDTNPSDWNKFGTGWASDYAKEYDECAKDGAGKSGTAGSALFKEENYKCYPLESLKIFNILRS
ncbi:MAG: glycosyl hydrolase 53 family protein [Eubacterium sp.]